MIILDSIQTLAKEWVNFSGDKEAFAMQWGTIERSIGDQVDVAALQDGIEHIIILQNPNTNVLHRLHMQLSGALRRDDIAARFGEGKKVKTSKQEDPFQWRYQFEVKTAEGAITIRLLTDNNRDGSVQQITLSR